MTVKELEELYHGDYLEVVNGKGFVAINLQYKKFESRIKNGLDSKFLELHETYEEAIEKIKNY